LLDRFDASAAPWLARRRLIITRPDACVPAPPGGVAQAPHMPSPHPGRIVARSTADPQIPSDVLSSLLDGAASSGYSRTVSAQLLQEGLSVAASEGGAAVAKLQRCALAARGRPGAANPPPCPQPPAWRSCFAAIRPAPAPGARLPA
jgi:hypothetical protein